MSEARRRQEHLYLVMDDWEMGCSIHKLDVDEFEVESDPGGGGNKLRRLPEPCALRIEAPADRSTAIVAALGSKMVLMTDRLYAFNPRRADQQCSFEVLSRAPRDEEDEFRLSRRAERWSVGSVPAPMPLGKHETVTAYAVHPDGCTIFVSARSRSRLDGEREGGTHSFDTRSSVWTWHGEWQLPFQGEGCYVHELDAWVGLRRDGFLCSCAVPPRGGGTVVQPEWKLWKKTMFHEDPERHVGQPTGATLTYMGNTAGVPMEEATDGEVDGCVLHVTMFGVKYDKRGDLQTTAHHARSYLVSR
ncbi:hypothetical protein PAHAL_7G276700 [Panicum hallii]|uniref:Uncharacterized protein n=1 Tax=Panicum hallii TaxID=206008 RepID=A0A2T8IDN2_9POAL|nr:hypothetical protein PAHAL_7G276700 [Panicum hallii]